jgi:hypothetical protein
MSSTEHYKLASEIALLLLSAMRASGVSMDSSAQLAANNASTAPAVNPRWGGEEERREIETAIERALAQTASILAGTLKS